MSAWLTIEKTCEVTGWTAAYVRMLVAAGKIDSRAGSERSRNGRTVKEYALASLPDEARARYLNGKRKAAPAENPTRPPVDSPLNLLPLFVERPLCACRSDPHPRRPDAGR